MYMDGRVLGHQVNWEKVQVLMHGIRGWLAACTWVSESKDNIRLTGMRLRYSSMASEAGWQHVPGWQSLRMTSG